MDESLQTGLCFAELDVADVFVAYITKGTKILLRHVCFHTVISDARS